MLHVVLKESGEKLLRRVKLERWAECIRRYNSHPALVHGLEYIHPESLATITLNAGFSGTPMGIAAQDPVFQSQGLSLGSSIKDAMAFFEITQEQLHAFSCDCGGQIDKEVMAQRIERLAE